MSRLVPVGRRPLPGCALLLAFVCFFLFVGTAVSKAAPVLDLETLDGMTAEKMMDAGELTSVELTQAYIDRIEALNANGPGLNAVTQFNKEALKEAQHYDELRAEGTVLSPAMGLPILLKDLIDVKGMYTSAGNWSLRDSYPETDSGVAKKLREHGVVILGKLGLSEYANYFGSQPSGFSNLTGQVVNAVDADQNPSGSSSGSGAAGAAALSMLTIGTETSGSITGPSRTEGLVGLRPTIGLVPGYGIAPIVASQDTAGPMDRTVANAALTLSSIAGPDPVNDAYYERYWHTLGIEPEEIAAPQPDPLPDYLSALDPDFVRGKRIGYFGNFSTNPEILEAKEALEDAGAILVERPLIATDPLPEIAKGWYPEMHLDIDGYYERLGASAPIGSLAEEVADNEADPFEALKFGNVRHKESSEVAYGLGSTYYDEVREKLPQRKAIAQAGIKRMLNNNTPGDPSDDFIAILGSTTTGPAPNGPLAGYPAITVPTGYSKTQRRAVGVSFSGDAYTERDLLGIAYVLEQQLHGHKPASELNPSMYRCSATVPAPAYSERGDCNPDRESTLAMAGGEVPSLSFSLEGESVAGLQQRMTAGTLTAVELTKAYLARIAVANTTGPAIQAVREVNDEALAEAAKLDAERARSGARGPLHGIPILLNDGIDAVGLESDGGSIALQGATPERNSRIVAKLKAAGAIILGTANVSELNGLFSSTMPEGYSSLGGQVLLPSDTDKTPAGSAAGSAAATASGMAAMAVGVETSTDTAQLIAPASAAGLVGLKPTVGRVGRSGVMPIARSQDSPGPLAKSVRDAAIQLQAIAGSDAGDPATTGAPAVPDYLSGLTTTALAGKRVAVISSASATYPEAVATIAGLGATTVTKTIGTPAANPIVKREFERDLNSYLEGLAGTENNSLAEIVEYNDEHRAEGLKYQQGELVEAAAVNLADPTEKATYENDLATGKATDKATIDAILNNGTEGDATDDIDVIAVPSGNALVGIADRAGYPVITVPAGFGTGSAGRNPIGLVLVAGSFEEAELLADAYAFEQATRVRALGPDYDAITAGVQPLAGGSGVPSYTNPSMWRCVPLSEFYAPEYCRPGTVDALAGPVVEAPSTGGGEGGGGGGATDADAPASPAPAEAAKPVLRLKVQPKRRTVGVSREKVAFSVLVANSGDAASGKVSLCVKSSAKRLAVAGKSCTTVSVAAKKGVRRRVVVVVEPNAIGKVTGLTVTATGPEIAKLTARATLRVKGS